MICRAAAVFTAITLFAAPAFAQDFDGDGYPQPQDCDDTDPTVNPGAVEIVADGVDQDCDGGELCYADFDGDGHGSQVTIASNDADCRDPGEASTATDCDDTDPSVNPDAIDVCNDGIDSDCDGLPSTEIALGLVQPGIAGLLNTWTASCAQTYSTVYLVRSGTIGFTPVPPCPGQAVGLAAPVIVGTSVADGQGVATFQLNVPAAAAGVTQHFQLVDQGTCNVSNVMTNTF